MATDNPLSDKLAVTVAATCDKTARILAAASPDLMRANERAYTALQVLLKAHEPIQLYYSADGCGHPRPDEDERDGEALSEWLEDHPTGAGPGPDADIGAICHLSPLGLACPECSRLVYETWGDENRWIGPGDCVARPFIARALLGEANSG